MRISAWSSDVCSSDLGIGRNPVLFIEQLVGDEAEFDRKPQPRPQGFGVDAGKIWKARVRQPVGDMPVRFEPDKIGRASCRERVCQYVYISVVAVSLQTK